MGKDYLRLEQSLEEEWKSLKYAMAAERYDVAMLHAERLTHSSRCWRNNYSVKIFLAVSMYRTGHMSYACSNAVCNLSKPKEGCWSWDSTYKQNIRDYNSFLLYIVLMCDASVSEDLQDSLKRLEDELDTIMQSNTFAWDDCGFTNRLEDIRSQILAPIHRVLKTLGVSLHFVYDLIRAVRALWGVRDDKRYSPYILDGPLRAAASIMKRCNQPRCIEELRADFDSLLTMTATVGCAASSPSSESDLNDLNKYFCSIQVVAIVEFMQKVKQHKHLRKDAGVIVDCAVHTSSILTEKPSKESPKGTDWEPLSGTPIEVERAALKEAARLARGGQADLDQAIRVLENARKVSDTERLRKAASEYCVHQGFKEFNAESLPAIVDLTPELPPLPPPDVLAPMFQAEMLSMVRALSEAAENRGVSERYARKLKELTDKILAADTKSDPVGAIRKLLEIYKEDFEPLQVET